MLYFLNTDFIIVLTECKSRFQSPQRTLAQWGPLHWLTAWKGRQEWMGLEWKSVKLESLGSRTAADV